MASATMLTGNTAPPIPSVLIGGHFRPDLTAPRSDVGRGHTAFAVVDRRGHATELMAIAVEPGCQPRVPIIADLAARPVPGLLGPVTFGGYVAPGAGGRPVCNNYVICALPPGPSLQAYLRPAPQSPPRAGATARTVDARATIPRMNDLEIVETVLRPAAHTLDALAARGFTHRAIRPDNLFSPGRGQPVILGTAWAGPPGALQPAIYEPPYLAQCHPGGRGDGLIADDVYALGVTLLALALGEDPARLQDDETILRRKLHVGSFMALVEEARLPPALSDLLRGMLAEDPEHRPPPVLLTDPGAARARRVAARPPRRAQRPLEVGGIEAWNARSLAHAMASFPEPGIQAIKTGAIDRWLRRMLGDAALAHRFDLVISTKDHDGADGPLADLLKLARATSALDPLAPFHWRGLAWWPEALGTLLAQGFNQRDITSRIEEIIDSCAMVAWADVRPERCDMPKLRSESRMLRQWFNARGMAGNVPRVLYAMNRSLTCQSPLTEGMLVSNLAEVLHGLEQVAANLERRQGLPADRHIVAFVAARSDHRLDTELVNLGNSAVPDVPAALLRLFTVMQINAAIPKLPHLAAWLAGLCAGRVEQWYGRINRERLASALKEAAEQGNLLAMLQALEDRQARAQDRSEAELAAAGVVRIDEELARIPAQASARQARAVALAHETVSAVGFAGLVGAVILMALGI